jgi:hypothetical protein
MHLERAGLGEGRGSDGILVGGNWKLDCPFGFGGSTTVGGTSAKPLD